MSTSASSLNWWCIDGSRLRISAGVRREAMSRKTPPCGDPRPALTSELIARATSSRGSRSGVRLLWSGSSYQRSASASLSAYWARNTSGHVVEHEPLALGVAQDAAVTAHRLGDQDPLDRRRPDHAGRVELDELHIEQGRSGPQRERVTVAGVLPRVGRDLERLADPAGRKHHGRRAEQHEPAALAVVAERAADRAGRIADQFGDRAPRRTPSAGRRGRRSRAGRPAAARRSSAAAS